MFDDTRSYIWGQFRSARPSFVSKKPNFNFITVHYFWIIGATLFASVLIYGGGKTNTRYIDSLMFASGANTQAGLNPIDVNDLNGFQQSMIYLFALLSNPISLHTSVVFLRLYWFEKRFQSWAKEVRQRRPSFTKSRSKGRPDLSRAEQDVGVNGRDITVIPRNGKAPRLTNDGTVLDGEHDAAPTATVPDDKSDTTTMTEDPNRSVGLESLEKPGANGLHYNQGQGADATPSDGQDFTDASLGYPTGQPAITFAETVKRSDGMGDDRTNFSQRRANAEHIAILERQRNPQDDDVLRIPGPRDAEKGLGPRRLLDLEHRDEDDQNPMARGLTRESHPDEAANNSRRFQGRQPTITIAEPERRKRDELVEDAKVIGSTIDSLRFRKPRFMSKQSHHPQEEDEESKEIRPVVSRTMDTIRTVLSRDKVDDMPYLSYTPTMGRNSNFVGLTLEQREELGGIEYRSLRTLALVLIFYFWVFHILGLVCFLPYILHHRKYAQVLKDASIGEVWWAFWMSNMAFMDVGFSLTADSMNSFAKSEWILMSMWFFIIIGNTGFPVMLRFIIWVFSKLAPKGSGIWEELMFLLDHPRRCFTLLFPSNANWWLFWILAVLNAVDLLFFIVLDLGAEPVAQLPLKNRVVVGLFQAASTRTAGFAAVSMSDLHPAMSILYMIMMYISVFPIAISIRRTNVYEEKSLGIYQDYAEDDEGPDISAFSYVGTHLRRQLSFDLWYVFLGFFVLAIAEGGKIMGKKFDLFAILFEIISAYGTVGLSIGVPGVNASLSSQFSVVGKLVIIAMQIRGRHRGLPYGLDRAVLLPNESRDKKEAEQAEAELARTNTAMSGAITTGLQRSTTRQTTGTRNRSKSRERVNSNLISQFLHPGPVVQHGAPVVRSRSRSIDVSNNRRGSSDVHASMLEPYRTQTEPVFEEDSRDLATVSSAGSRYKTQRAGTTLF